MAKRTRHERRARRARRTRRRRQVRSLLGVAAVIWAIDRWRSSPQTPNDATEPEVDWGGRYDKRYYADLSTFQADFRAMWASRDRMRAAMRAIDPAFRTRLMLAVTQVNGCRYCSYYHAQIGLQEGLTQSEIDDLLAGIAPDADSSPPKQTVAILYAQHWAETHGAPETSARERLYDTYGAGTAEQIEMLLRAISMGNLLGNTLDYVLFRLGLVPGA